VSESGGGAVYKILNGVPEGINNRRRSASNDSLFRIAWALKAEDYLPNSLANAV